MKRFSRIATIALGLILVSSTITFAETTFTPLNFEDNSSAISATQTTSTSASTTPKASDILDPSQVTGGTKMQNSLLQIDNAQVEIRNRLLNYKNQYAEVDNRYNKTKSERAAAKKQIKYAEKKIKNLEKAKKTIRKNFERRVNI